MTPSTIDSPPDPVDILLERTRAAVLNVLIAVGGMIALSGLALRPRDRGATGWPRETVEMAAHVLLFALIAASVLARRTLGSRSRLREPATRAERFHRAHLVSAVIGGLAVPLGFASAFAVRPTLEAVAVFWVAAIAIGILSLPRRHELDDFDAPLPRGTSQPESSEPGP